MPAAKYINKQPWTFAAISPHYSTLAHISKSITTSSHTVHNGTLP